MTPRQRLSQKIGGLPKWQRWMINTAATATSALVLIAATKPIWQPAAKDVVVAALGETYVLQAHYDRDTLRSNVRHQTEVDSILRLLRDQRASLARVDSNSRCNRRNKPAYCE